MDYRNFNVRMGYLCMRIPRFIVSSEGLFSPLFFPVVVVVVVVVVVDDDDDLSSSTPSGASQPVT